MSLHDDNPVTLAERIADLTHNVAVLDSIAQLALVDVHLRAGHYARLGSIARHGAHADHTDAERSGPITLLQQLSEQYEAQARRHHQSLRLAFAQRWLIPGDDHSLHQTDIPR